jgi:hypothetical protein
MKTVINIQANQLQLLLVTEVLIHAPNQATNLINNVKNLKHQAGINALNHYMVIIFSFVLMTIIYIFQKFEYTQNILFSKTIFQLLSAQSINMMMITNLKQIMHWN